MLKHPNQRSPFFYLLKYFRVCIVIALFAVCVPGAAQNPGTISSKKIYLDSCPKAKVTFVDHGKKVPITTIEKRMTVFPSGDFTNFNTEDGLALTSISCGFKDKRGNLWFGTYGGGVSCYNGKSFTNYSTVNGPADKLIHAIAEDTKGNLWFGAEKGLTIYDGKAFKSLKRFEKSRVSHITKCKNGTLLLTINDIAMSYTPALSGVPDDGDFQTISFPEEYKKARIKEIFQDSKHNIWFIDKRGIVMCYRGELPLGDNANFTCYTDLKDLKTECIEEDNKGNIWIGTHTGAYRFNGKSFTRFTSADGLADNVILSITQDRQGRLWFGTNNGVSYCGPGMLSLPKINFLSYTSKQGLSHNIVFSITEDNSGNLWFGTFGGGLSRYNGDGFTAYSINKDRLKNNVRSILEDTQGNLWFGLHSGEISFFDGISVITFDALERFAATTILCATQDRRGNIWFGTNDKGVLCYSAKSSPDRNSVFTTYSIEQGLASNAIRCITEDSEGNLWFGSFGGGATCFSPDIKQAAKGVFTTYTKLQGLADNYIWSILEDRNGVIWFATNSGISSFDGKTFTSYVLGKTKPLNVVRSIAEDKNGILWFGTTEGIIGLNNKRVQGNNSDFVYYTTNNGLGDNTIYDLVVAPFPSSNSKDTINALVVGTNAGFSVLTGWKDKTGKFISFENPSVSIQAIKDYTPVWEIYNNKTGYPVKDLNTNAMCVTKLGFTQGSDKNNKNSIWGGCGDDKIVRFDPFQINKNPNPPLPTILSVKVDEEKISWYDLYLNKNKKTLNDSLAAVNEETLLFGNPLNDTARALMQQRFSKVEFSGITPWYPVPENLVLPYAHNNISFDFIAVETGKSFLVRYQYMLDGYDKDWRPVTDKTSANFGNIHEGTYTFKLKACSPEGIWSEPVTYTFSVLPPWYRTWWMYLVYIILLIVLVVLIVWWNSRRLVAQKNELEQKVKIATTQIREEKEKVEHANELISEQKKVVEEKNKDILDSIHYAKRIQDALLKPEEHISPHLPEHFVLFMPKDIVSGDFYWSFEKNDYWYIAAVDCTGHGVPGAFMSMLGMSFLNDIIADGQNITPAEVLEQLRNKVITELRQTGELGGSKDGMDISLVRINIKTKEVQWAGANNPILIVENGQLSEIKPDKQPIGYYPAARPFTNHTIPFGHEASIYIFSDGFNDQFGGAEGKKFKIKQLKELLLTIQEQPMDLQKDTLKKAFFDWKGALEQIDDVCVIGVRL